MTFVSPSKPILIEFAAASSPRPRTNSNRQSWAPLSSPQSTSTTQLYASTSIRREPIILTYRSPLRTESQSLLETDGETLPGILETRRAKHNDEALHFVHPAELHHFPALNNERVEFSETVGVKSLPYHKTPRRRIFDWAFSSDRRPSPPENTRQSGPSLTSSQSQRLRAPFLTTSTKRNTKHGDIAQLQEKSTDLSRRSTWASSASKSFHITSLPSLVSKRENNLSSPTIFCRKKKPKFEPEPIESPERRPPPPPLPPHLRLNVNDNAEREAAQGQRPSSLVDSLSLGSSLGYDYYDDDEFDPQIVAFGSEVLLDDDEDLSSMTGDDSSMEHEEVITPSSSHPYALVGFQPPDVTDEGQQEDAWDDVVVLEHTLEEYVLANPISLNLHLSAPHRRSSCPSINSSKRRTRSSRSHRRPSVPLGLPRSVSSMESISISPPSQNELGLSKPPNLPQVGSPAEERLRPPLVIETLLDDGDADFLDLHESIYSRTLSSISRRGSFLSDNREDFLDLEWSSAGDESSLRL